MSGKAAAVSQLRGGASSVGVPEASLVVQASFPRDAGGLPSATESRGGFRDTRAIARTTGMNRMLNGLIRVEKQTYKIARESAFFGRGFVPAQVYLRGLVNIC